VAALTAIGTFMGPASRAAEAAGRIPIRLQDYAASSSGSAEVTSLGARFRFNTGSGFLLVAVVATGTSCSDPIASVTDSGGNTWQRAASVCLPDAFPNLEVWYTPDAIPLPARNVFASWTQPAHATMDIYAFVGQDNPPALGRVATALGHGELRGGSGVVVPTFKNELAVGAIAGDAVQTIKISASRFHNLGQLAAGGALTMRSGADNQVPPAGESYDGGWRAPMDWVALIVLFKSCC
jgi:hypothetical protein